VFNLPDELSELLQHDPTTYTVVGREGKRREFKLQFVDADFSEYAKALAAFSNADGGVLILGVSDKPRQIIGVDLTTIPDEAKWANRLREDFDPEIVISTRTYEVANRNLFVAGVDPSPHRPVICKKTRTKLFTDKSGKQKDVEVLREGTIYYRYAGQTKAIGFAELSAMLDEREKRRMQKIIEALKVVERVGFDRAGVVDITAGEASNIFVSRETAKGLTFIDKANLVHDKGAPAYVVLGQVQLSNVVHAPLEEADKNLPTEAAEQLRPVVKEMYGPSATIAAQQVTKVLRRLQLDDDDRYCVKEKKLKRKYITRAGIKAVADFIRSEPLEAIRVFGARHAIAQYEQGALLAS
jgi:Schlafen, AlbA_2